MHTVIVANAPNLDAAQYATLLDAADLLIAADGGALPLLRAGRPPQTVVGDLDSIDTAAEAELVAFGVEWHRSPRAKDETDLELAFLLAVERGATTIDVLGALGGRWDHTLANVAMLDMAVLRDRRVRLIDGNQTLFVVRDQAALEGTRGDTISLLPLTPQVHGVTTTGLLYPLNDATLHFERARGVSNVLLEPPGMVTLREGLLLVVQHDDGGALQWRGGV